MLLRRPALSFSLTLLALTTVTLAQDGPRVTISNAEQASRVVNDLSTYITHLTAQPAFTSVASVVATALPSSVVSSLAQESGPLHGILPSAGELTTESWFTALPTDVQSYFQSAARVEQSIASEGAVNGAMPTAAPVMKAWIAGVAGAVGAAAVLV